MEGNITVFGLDAQQKTLYTYNGNSLRIAKSSAKNMLETMPLVKTVVALEITTNVISSDGHIHIYNRPNVLFVKRRKTQKRD